MKAAAAIANILKAEGTEYLFCFPVNALIDECARVGIRPIVARTERTLLNMADGYSRASNGRRIGVAAVQHGPGAENAYAGVAQAFADGSPLLFLPGGNPAARVDIAPNFDAPQSYRTDHQVVGPGQRRGASPGPDAPGVHAAPQRASRPGAAGSAGRCGRRRGGAVRLSPGPGPARRRRPRVPFGRRCGLCAALAGRCCTSARASCGRRRGTSSGSSPSCSRPR